MKRFLAFFLCLLLAFPLPAFAAKESPSIIASGTAAAGAVLLSTVNGTAFVDVNGDATLTSALQSAVTHNDVIEFTSKTDKTKKIWGFVKAAGTGTFGVDNLGDALFADDMADDGTADFITFDSTLTFDTDHYVWTRTTTSYGWSYNAFATQTVGVLYKLVVGMKLGTMAAASVAYYPALTQSQNLTGNYADYAYYGTAISPSGAYANFGVFSNNGANGQTILCKGYSLSPVTGPSASGVTITNTPGGTTYNWGANTLSGTSYNDAAGYDWRILSSTKYGQVIASAPILPANARFDGTAANAFAWLNGVDLTAYQTGNYILWLSDGTNAGWGYISATPPTGDGGGSEATGTDILPFVNSADPYDTFT
ncbi:MAG: hypothetical protein PHQ43_13675, partial [Dehalococcoidales bacterium]|nr:hypothetical protein [Dehalococcoidales bacterium]